MVEENGSILLCDGFIQADQGLDKRVTPFSIKFQQCCLVSVEDVSKNVPSRGYLHCPVIKGSW